MSFWGILLQSLYPTYEMQHFKKRSIRIATASSVWNALVCYEYYLGVTVTKFKFL